MACRFLHIIGNGVLLLSLTGCGAVDALQFEHFTQDYRAGNYCSAAGVALKKVNICEADPEGLSTVWAHTDEQLNAGTALFLAQKHESSTVLFETAAGTIQEDLASSGIARGTIEVLGNASLVNYNPMILDSVYLHAYGILNALSAGNKDEAKIQVNRAYSVQQAAVEAFRKEIAQANQDAAAEAAQMEQSERAANGENIARVMDKYKEFARWKGYADFVNPYVTYISGLYLMTNGSSSGDFETASNYMKRVSGMARNNSFVKDDLVLANRLAAGNKKALRPTVWVIFENGLVAHFKEFRIDLPMFLVDDHMQTASLALPYPEQRDEAAPNLAVTNGKNRVTTQMLADIDNIFIAEFNKKLPTIVAKAVTKLTLQTVAQVMAQKELGNFGGIAAAVYSLVTAGADTRSWYGLPKNVQLAKLRKNGTKITVIAGENKYDVAVPAEGNSIVYVRMVDAATPPAIEVFNL